MSRGQIQLLAFLDPAPEAQDLIPGMRGPTPVLQLCGSPTAPCSPCSLAGVKQEGPDPTHVLFLAWGRSGCAQPLPLV